MIVNCKMLIYFFFNKKCKVEITSCCGPPGVFRSNGLTAEHKDSFTFATLWSCFTCSNILTVNKEKIMLHTVQRTRFMRSKHASLKSKSTHASALEAGVQCSLLLETIAVCTVYDFKTSF